MTESRIKKVENSSYLLYIPIILCPFESGEETGKRPQMTTKDDIFTGFPDGFSFFSIS